MVDMTAGCWMRFPSEVISIFSSGLPKARFSIESRALLSGLAVVMY
jgi:hypothetical protein